MLINSDRKPVNSADTDQMPHNPMSDQNVYHLLTGISLQNIIKYYYIINIIKVHTSKIR